MGERAPEAGVSTSRSSASLRRPAFPRMSPGDVERLRSRLTRALGDSKVVTGEAAVFAYAGDESEQEPVLPDAVVLASCARDVATTLGIASELGAPVTPRGAGTGKSGGCVPVCGGVALAMVGMHAIKEIDRREQLCVVEPGVVLAELHAAVEAEGLFYPPDPNSLKMCVLGGNVAENAGGPRAFKYGTTRDYVLGLDVVTADGKELVVGRRTKKGVTGYDLTALLVGSEGTLAVTTSCTLRLIHKPESVATLLALYPDIDAAMRGVADIVGGSDGARGIVPRCAEVMDGTCVAALRNEGFGVDARAGALLILEVDGDVHAVERAMEEVGGRAADAGAVDVLAAQDEAQRARLWEARRQFSLVTRKLARAKISEDVVVPRTELTRLVMTVREIEERHRVRMLTYGHAGDGNLHVNFLWDDPADEPKVELALEELFRAVIALRGTLTGEHGVGTSKAPYLALEQSNELIDLQMRIKATFDPKGILNPGKIFPRRGHGSC